MRRVLLAVAVFAITALIVPVAGADSGHSQSHGRSDQYHGRSDEHHGDDHSAGPTTYAVIGDTPYGLPQIENFPNDIGEINADPKVRLVMHSR
ncbi:MAG TPA: hypothetical protein VKC63_06030 [Solirubrobacterales bacterium]|nr:hypothetical protein [Solirubrobacterales bacterium]